MRVLAAYLHFVGIEFIPHVFEVGSAHILLDEVALQLTQAQL